MTNFGPCTTNSISFRTSKFGVVTELPNSSDVSTCVVPRTHTGFGDRAFQVAGPRLWNNLPASLRQSDTTVGQFKKLLNTHLFS